MDKLTEAEVLEDVLEVLETIRAGGHVNMMDRHGVAFLAELAWHFDAANWILRADAGAYMAVLEEMGRRHTATAD